MNKRRNRVVFMLAAVALAAAVLLLFGRAPTRHAEPLRSAVAPVAAVAPSPTPAAKSPAEPPDGTAHKPTARDAEAADYLRAEFAATIFNKHTQIKALEKLIAYLMKTYPEDWQDRVYALLKQAFPDRADELYGQFLKLSKYNDWMREHRGEIMTMPAAERRAALWELRHRFFGDDVAEIWEVALKNEQIYDALDAIERSPGSSISDKLDVYVDSVKQAYGDEAERFIEKRGTELMDRFLSVETVQNDLRSLSADERELSLRSIREAMGMDDQALERWQTLDRQRDSAWNIGSRYMQQREEIAKTYSGEQFDQRLNALQEQMFGAEAEVIRSEEAGGFFRFGHQRMIGKE